MPSFRWNAILTRDYWKEVKSGTKLYKQLVPLYLSAAILAVVTTIDVVSFGTVIAGLVVLSLGSFPSALVMARRDGKSEGSRTMANERREYWICVSCAALSFLIVYFGTLWTGDTAQLVPRLFLTALAVLPPLVSLRLRLRG